MWEVLCRSGFCTTLYNVFCFVTHNRYSSAERMASVDFYLDWSDYKYGFGSVASEHWLGNDKIHRLSTQKAYQLRVDLEDFDENTTYALYDQFNLGTETTKYTLLAGSYSGDAGIFIIQFNSVQFNSIQFNAIQFNSIHFISIQFNLNYQNCCALH